MCHNGFTLNETERRAKGMREWLRRHLNGNFHALIISKQYYEDSVFHPPQVKNQS